MNTIFFEKKLYLNNQIKSESNFSNISRRALKINLFNNNMDVPELNVLVQRWNGMGHMEMVHLTISCMRFEYSPKQIFINSHLPLHHTFNSEPFPSFVCKSVCDNDSKWLLWI